ncbi:TauD/TfdA family dioxygenase [Azospirillum brasilense]|uniref:TauD/TfdA family dioxygenase n=1 Tax=Azospirillum brasilense TaxID=192 RepID=UPI001FFF5DD9|nr:TauD/TfdA family dioxygenase [Azospirillum brasilense]
MRGELAEAAPGLSALATAIRDRLETSHSGVLIRRAHLGRHDLDTRRRLLYALAVGIGAPRIDRKVVWDIKLRPELVRSGGASTFSEHADEADFHTDTQYFPNPERYMLLYFAQAAACGGGRSSLRDARCVREALSGSDEGRWALDLLSRTALPFRIPATFTRTGSVTFATVFGDRPLIRFRTDTLRRGLAARPEHNTPDVRRALAILRAELDNPARRLETFMESDSLLAMNNHEALHGRGAFADPDRHALRIRIDDGAPQDGAPKDQAR